MSANNYYYTYDDCYIKQITPTFTDASFDDYLARNYYHYTVARVKDCENKALRNNSEFFLINDISRSLNNTYTNCYIPKLDNNNNDTSIFGNNTVIQRARDLFDGLFKPPNTSIMSYSRQITPNPIDTCNNLMYNYIRYPYPNDAERKCFKYSIDGGIYTPKSSYAYYTKPTFSLENIALMKTVRLPSYYTNPDVLDPLRNYINILRFNPPVYDGTLTIAFRNYICTPSPTSNDALDGQLNLLKRNYVDLYARLGEIKSDLSSIIYLNSFDDETLRSLNVNIVNKSRELNSLLTSGGANNGRLDDTTLLTYFKIVENSILLLLIICFILYFTKKKAI